MGMAVPVTKSDALDEGNSDAREVGDCALIAPSACAPALLMQTVDLLTGAW
jgi:hypothetical protein